ncbi:hypothetical protein YQE_04994, partial [Dendroctonus ponderosae]
CIFYFRLSQSTPSSPRLLPRRTRGITGVSAHASASGLVPRPDSVHTFESGSSDATVGEVDWKQRCLELQLELHRTKAQSTRTRDMLRDKDQSKRHSGGFDPLARLGEITSDATAGEVDWKQRCLELQLELHRTKAQSTRTRDMLRDKTAGLRYELIQAELEYLILNE